MTKHMKKCHQTQNVELERSRKDVKYPNSGICPDCGEDFGKLEGNRIEKGNKK